jgi:hypothetical protein
VNPCLLSRYALSLAFCVATSCGAYTQSAARGSDAFETIVVSPRVSSANTLGRRDIAPYEGRSLAEALGQLRPDWLRPDPSTRVSGESGRAVLYVNDVVSGDLTALRTIAAAAVLEVRLLSRSEAWSRYGPQCRCPAGAIVVHTRSAK